MTNLKFIQKTVSISIGKMGPLMTQAIKSTFADLTSTGITLIVELLKPYRIKNHKYIFLYINLSTHTTAM